MVATLSGIGLGFLALGFLFQTYARPIVGLTTLTLVFIVYLGRMRFLWRLPGSFVVLLFGGILSWVSGIAPIGDDPFDPVGVYAPRLALGRRGKRSGGQFMPYLSIKSHVASASSSVVFVRRGAGGTLSSLPFDMSTSVVS